MVNNLSRRIGALKKISKISSFQTRLSVCTSLVTSKILYMIPLYCGCPDFLLNVLQTKQNEAMRIVTKKKWEVLGLRLTSTKQLLKECGYLSIKQMAYNYSVASVHKILVHCEPEYLHQVLTAALSSGV